MYTAIVEGDQVSLDLELLCQVGLKLLVDVVDDGQSAVLLVDLITEPCCAHHGQSQPHIAFLQVCRHMQAQAYTTNKLGSIYRALGGVLCRQLYLMSTTGALL